MPAAGAWSWSSGERRNPLIRCSEIQQRDWDDSTGDGPLRQAEDAVVVDTTELNFEESLAALLTVVRGKGGA